MEQSPQREPLFNPEPSTELPPIVHDGGGSVARNTVDWDWGDEYYEGDLGALEELQEQLPPKELRG